MKIILLEFKRTDDYSEAYYRDMKRVADMHEKLFCSYWRQTFGPPSSLLQLLGKSRSKPLSYPRKESIRRGKI